jgi:putative phosphoribosyl transferase
VTAEAALQAARLHSPASLVLAEPVCASDTAWRLSAIADHICCAQTPEQLHAVGQWYEQFDPTPDAEVLRHLAGRVP